MAVPDAAVVVQAGERRLARLESLRAIAALGVLIGHAWGFVHQFGPDALATFGARVIYGGGFGVFLFFVLTGYLLFWPFVRRDYGDGTPVALAGYARNRVLRILPLYFVAVAVPIVLSGDAGDLRLWARFGLLAQNFSADTVAHGVNPVLWSVIVEVHFYVLLPLLAAGLAVLARGSRGRAALLVAALGGLGLAVRLITVVAPVLPSPLWVYNLPANFVFFVPGMLLALLRLELEQRPRALGSSALWMAASGAVWLVVFADYDLQPLAAVAGFLLVGSCCLPLQESRARRALDARPLAALGVASYSLYVWGGLVQERFPDSAAGQLVAVPVALAVAAVSYRLVERPFLALRQRWSG